MAPEANSSTNVADKMKSVKAACDMAPERPKKDAALKHCRVAEKAHKARNVPDTIKDSMPRLSRSHDMTRRLHFVDDDRFDNVPV